MTDTVTIPRDEYEAMRARIEDLDDIIAAHEAKTGFTLPHEFAMRIIEGGHPLRVWRDYRGVTAVALAEKAGISKTYLSEIETGKKPGSIEAYKAVAQALSVPMDAIVP
ncbi:MAG: helix-turn-helix transcriptional regulator [Clostridiaceae bacterium]|nr:helix-turn-helix transcriptional regulator [Clostridiaceae bacterium]